jgi:hypothetical protein
MTAHNRPLTLARTIVAILALAILGAVPAGAATVHLKDGRVLEGRIQREEDNFIYLVIKVGQIERVELILKSDIERLVRDETPSAGANAPSAADGGKPDAAPADAPGDDVVRVAFITVGDGGHKDMVGPFVNAGRLKAAIDLLEDDDPDFVVLKFNSGGGYVSEVEPLSDAIHEYIKPKYTVVSWIQSAISAAAMTSLTCENIYFMSKGNFGAATAFSGGAGGAKAVEGEGLEHLLYMAEQISSRGGYDPLIMRAMQVEQELSADIDERGVVTWRPDLKGRYIVNPEGKILTFNAVDAVKFGFADGVADSKEELVRQLVGDKEWVEVGQDADEFAVRTRDDTFRAELEIVEIFQKIQIAQNASDWPKVRRYLNDLRAWARRAPVWTEYAAKASFPPLNDEFFKQAEEEIRKAMEAERERDDRRR